jgi:glutathione transport system ATP-binding protein
LPSDDSAQRILEVDGLTVDFVTTDRVVHAVRDLSFAIGRGETIAVVGSSAISKRGLQESAIAIMQRWRSPPES